MAVKKSAVKSAAKKAPAKKVAAKSVGVKTAVKKAAAKAPARKAPEHKPGPTHEEISKLAYKFYQERGHHHHGHEAHDWARAEAELRGKA